MKANLPVGPEDLESQQLPFPLGLQVLPVQQNNETGPKSVVLLETGSHSESQVGFEFVAVLPQPISARMAGRNPHTRLPLGCLCKANQKLWHQTLFKPHVPQ